MKWLGIALVLYFLIYGFIEEAKERLSGYDDNDNYDDDYDESWNNNYSCNQQTDNSKPHGNNIFSSFNCC